MKRLLFGGTLAGGVVALSTALLLSRNDGRHAGEGAQEGRVASAIEVRSPVHDFGEVLQSQSELEHTFLIVNRGREPIPLVVKKLGCNCLTVDCPSSVPPGAEARCAAHISLGSREGTLEVTARIETAQPKAPPIILTVRLNIVPDSRIDPPMLEFKDAPRAGKLSAECRVMTASGQTQDRASEAVRWSIHDEGIACEDLGALHVAANDGRLDRWVHRFRIRVDTQRLSRIEQHVFLASAVTFLCPQGSATVAKPFPVAIEFRSHDHLAGPRTVVLRRGAAQSRSVALKSLDGAPFVVTDVHSPVPEILTQIEQRDASPAQALTLRFQPSALSRDAPRDAPIARHKVAARTDRWPKEPYEFEVLLLP